MSTSQMVLEKNKESDRKKENLFTTICDKGRALREAPYLGRLINVCILTFAVYSALYTLMLWFPELFKRFQQYAEKHPDETPDGVCVVSLMKSDNFSVVKNFLLTTIYKLLLFVN